MFPGEIRIDVTAAADKFQLFLLKTASYDEKQPFTTILLTSC